ncbi:MAG TPA: hypothetical protein VKC11_11290 [Steroidobacteraceae bacterium]|nr:hypothetical protein [Steroidobacteraceae bacterium]
MKPLQQMCKSTSKRLRTDFSIGCVALAVGAGAWAGDRAWEPTSSLGPQVTLYVNQPLWSRGTNRRSYGLRLEQVRCDAGMPQRAAFGVVHRKVLLDLQIRSQSDVRVEVATRVTWDLSRESFGPDSNDYRLVFRLPLHALNVAAIQSIHP